MKNKVKVRIDLIDNFRGLAMMYVIFIHVLFWMNFFTDKRGYFLVEMQLFFSITGMALYFSKIDNLLLFYIKRIKRIMIPYLICVTFYSFINLTVASLQGKKYEWFSYFYKWWNPFCNHESLLPFLPWALWFVPVYLLVVFMAPVLRKYFHHSYGSIIIPVVLLLLNYCFSFITFGIDLLQSALFYLFWVYMGFMYIKYMHKKPWRSKVVSCMICAFLAFIVFLYFKKIYIISLDMQANKFPPNFAFMLYGLIWMPLVCLFSREINACLKYLNKYLFFNWVYEPYKKYCYTVFLFHPLGFLFVNYAIRILGIKKQFYSNDIVAFFIVLITVIFISSILERYLGRLEQWEYSISRK